MERFSFSSKRSFLGLLYFRGVSFPGLFPESAREGLPIGVVALKSREVGPALAPIRTGAPPLPGEAPPTVSCLLNGLRRPGAPPHLTHG